jgi:predicted nucleic acid-binding protein
LQPGEAVLSVITYGELLYRVAKSGRTGAAILTLQRLIQIIPLLPLPEAAASAYGTIRADLETRGKVIGNNDLWIAAHAMAAGLILVTNNDKRVPEGAWIAHSELGEGSGQSEATQSRLPKLGILSPCMMPKDDLD